MTVEELIMQLEELPQGAEVVMYYDGNPKECIGAARQVIDSDGMYQVQLMDIGDKAAIDLIDLIHEINGGF